MRRSLFEKFDRISRHVKPFALRYVYRALTDDQSAPRNADEADIDNRTLQVVEMEDTDIVPDMRVHNAGRKGIFDEFWKACEQILSEKLGFAVDDRRHNDKTKPIRVNFYIESPRHSNQFKRESRRIDEVHMNSVVGIAEGRWTNDFSKWIANN